MKKPITLSLVAILVCATAFYIIDCPTVNAAQTIINTNTTWTKANSPYSLTGNTLVYHGVTLTIEPGVTVNFNGYYIMVNGTLQARGTVSDKITFDGGQNTEDGEIHSGTVWFSPSSTGWNEQSSSGCILENVIISNNGVIEIRGGSPKIDTVSFQNAIGLFSWDASPTVINCDFTSRDNSTSSVIGLHSGSGVFSNNNVQGKIQFYGGDLDVRNNVITGGVGTTGSTTLDSNTIHGDVHINGHSTLTNNIIDGHVSCGDSRGGGLTDNNLIDSNTIQGDLTVYSGVATVSNNKITGGKVGISLGYSYILPSVEIYRNIISGCSDAGIRGSNNGFYTQSKTTIKDNLIYNCNWGIDCDLCNSATGNVVYGNTYGVLNVQSMENNLVINNRVGVKNVAQIRGNTIANNDVGIESKGAEISDNNLQNNALYTFNLTSSADATAANNWWGTTDQDTISQKIYDYEDDFTLGRLIFTPFLTAPNPNAPAIPAALPTAITPLPTPPPTEPPSATPTVTNSPPPTSIPTQSNTENSTPFSLDLTELGLLAIIALLIVIVGFLVWRIRR